MKSGKVTLVNKSTDAERTTTTDDNGRYTFVSLAPGTYRMTVDGGSGFSNFTAEDLVVTVGEDAAYNPKLQLRGVQQSVTVTSQPPTVETSKSEVSQTVDQTRIDNLPINGRNYINFTLTNSQTTRDVSPTIGPAPNSGLNIAGARARSNMVTVDGADAVDNSVNGIRSTVSQEAVQEFQLILSNYNAEYGRATGGVVNIVTKSGGNEFHGDVFGYFRNKSFQARNAFSGQVDPATGNLEPVKQAYTRTQSGLTIGGPIKKDKTFFFGSYEYTQREETGFSSIGIDNFGLSPFSCGGCGLTGLLLTPDQSAAVLQLLGQGQVARASQYAALMGSASSVALNKVDPGLVAPGLTGGFLNPGPGAQFPLPVDCPARTAGQQWSDLLYCRNLCCATPSLLYRTEFDSRQLPGAGKNQLVVSATGSKLEQQQSFLPSRGCLAITGYRTPFHFSKPGLRTKLWQPRWLQSIARPERNLPARYGDQPNVGKHFPLSIRTAWPALRLLAASWRRSNRR